MFLKEDPIVIIMFAQLNSILVEGFQGPLCVGVVCVCVWCVCVCVCGVWDLMYKNKQADH